MRVGTVVRGKEIGLARRSSFRRLLLHPTGGVRGCFLIAVDIVGVDICLGQTSHPPAGTFLHPIRLAEPDENMPT